MAKPLTAAGGVVWRRRGPTEEVLLVHRAKYDDWSLPKGKPNSRENSLHTAVREVTEEIGLPFRLGPTLGTVCYDLGGRAKRVRYWSMQVRDSDLEPAPADLDEVDDYAWITLARAKAMLSYRTDIPVLDRWEKIGTARISLIYVRHGRAGTRAKWKGNDTDRPLDGKGQRQAAALAASIPAFDPYQVLSAPLVRCRSTVEPLATRIGRSIELLPGLSDAAYGSTPSAAIDLVRRLIRGDDTVVACSQGDTMRAALAQLLPTQKGGYDVTKGGFWVFGTLGGRIASRDYYRSLAP